MSEKQYKSFVGKSSWNHVERKKRTKREKRTVVLAYVRTYKHTDRKSEEINQILEYARSLIVS